MANVCVGAALVAYFAQAPVLPPAFRWPMLVAQAIVIAVLGPASFYFYVRQGRTLRALAKGAAHGEAAFRQAAREVARFPDLLFWAVAALWALGVPLALALARLQVAVPLSVLFRLALVALFAAPLGALLAYLLCLPQARKLLELLSGMGVGYEGMAAAVPQTRRQMRLRLRILAGILLICPTGLIAGLAVFAIQDGFAEVRAASSKEAKRAALERAVEESASAMVSLGGLGLLFALAIAYAGGGALAGPLRELSKKAEQREGGAEGLVAEDELWEVCSAFATLEARLGRLVAALRRASSGIDGATPDLGRIASSANHGSQAQAAALAETSTTTSQLATAAQVIADNAAVVAQIAAKTLGAARSAQERSQSFVTTMERLRQDNAAISGAVGALQQKVQQVGNIVEFIDGVADNADLLALNAELEGTRAGEIGRGFSLVAGEMRKLAEHVVRATAEITASIARVRQAAGAAEGASVEGVKTTGLGIRLALEMSENLERIFAAAEATSSAAKEISGATHAQRSGAEQLSLAMECILAGTDSEVGTTREMTDVATALSDLAKNLQGALERLDIR